VNETNRGRDVQEALIEQQKRFYALIENSADGILVTNRDGAVLFASPSIERIFGYTVEEFKSIKPRGLIHPDDLEIATTNRKWSDENPGKAVSYTIRLLNKSGKWMWHEATVINLFDTPYINGYLTNMRDITERKILEKHKEDFIGIATHELKTPITSIKAYAQFLKKHFEKEKDIRSAELIGKMDNQVNKLIGLIEDLLDVTRAESGRLTLNEGLYDFNELVTEEAADLQRTHATHRIIMKLEPTPKVYGDREKIRQVLCNLINNGIKYSPGKGEIIITSSLNGGEIQLCVEDHGVGIPEDLKERIFERFYRVSGPYTNTFPGLGLGLYISSEIIKRHHGRIWVDSKKGEGSTFCFCLPLDYRLVQ
jgi:PAS domain S-box-containing protein